MTTQSSNNGSNKSGFGTYFRYRLRSQLKYLTVSFALNLFMLPLFSVNMLIMMKNEYDRLSAPMTAVGTSVYDLRLNILTGGLQTVSAIVLLLLTLLSGVKVFDYCVHSERTDTFGGLPVTLRGRFFADLLSGYITRVAPIIPCAVFSLIMSVPIENYYSKLVTASEEYFDGIVAQAFAELAAALFITYTFAYILSVIITVCCGRTASSVTYTVIVSLGLLVICFSACGFGITSQLIDNSFEKAFMLLEYVPPLGTFFGKAYSVYVLISVFKFDWLEYDIAAPAALVIYTVIAAALIALAYFFFKRRKPENTGHPVAVKAFYHIFAGAVAVALIFICCWSMYQLHMWWLSVLVAAIVSAVTLTVFAVSNKYDRPRIKKNLIRNTAITAGCIGLLLIFDKTGAFGTRFYNHSAEKTQSITVSINDNSIVNPRSETIVIDSKEDIGQFISATNKTLKNRADELDADSFGGSLSVTYNLENGKEVYRSYSIRSACRFTERPNAIEEMFENVYDLPNYTKYSSESARDAINLDNASGFAVMHDKFGEVIIPDDRLKEFGDILTREMLEKFDKNAKNVGRAYVEAHFYRGLGYYESIYRFPILECYTDTIAFVESFREYDGEEYAFSVSTYDKDFRTAVWVKIKNADGPEEKELFSLFEPMSDEQYYNLRSSGFSITSSNKVEYYIPDENKERALELILAIIEKNYSQQSS